MVEDTDNVCYDVEWYDPVTGCWFMALEKEEKLLTARNKIDDLLVTVERVRLLTVKEEYFTKLKS